MNTTNVTAAKPSKAGAVFRAPKGTALPTSATEELNQAFKALGYVSEDGLTNANSPSGDKVKAWGGDTVLNYQTDKTVRVKDGHIIATGKEAKRCLDDVACEKVIPAGSNLADAVRSAYDESSKFHNIEFSEQALGVSYDHQISNKSFMLLCQTMCQDTDTGWRVVRSGKRIVAEFYKPEANPNRVLSERYGSLKVDSITRSTENQKNVAIVLGEGEGEARFRVRVDMSGGAQKLEMFVDARDVIREEGESDSSYSARLKARGVEALLEKQGTLVCALNPLPKEFGTMYDLGDVITVLLPDYGMKMQARITRFTQQSQNNVIETILEVGNITITR